MPGRDDNYRCAVSTGSLSLTPSLAPSLAPCLLLPLFFCCCAFWAAIRPRPSRGLSLIRCKLLQVVFGKVGGRVGASMSDPQHLRSAIKQATVVAAPAPSPSPHPQLSPGPSALLPVVLMEDSEINLQRRLITGDVLCKIYSVTSFRALQSTAWVTQGMYLPFYHMAQYDIQLRLVTTGNTF